MSHQPKQESQSESREPQEVSEKMKSQFPKLRLPSIKLRVRRCESGEVDVWDTLRGGYLRLTPEEWVRQHVIAMLIDGLGYERAVVRCECPVEINGQPQRADIVIFRESKPYILVECKAPSIGVAGEALQQVARYNTVLHASYILVTNGVEHITLEMADEKYRSISRLPRADETK